MLRCAGLAPGACSALVRRKELRRDLGLAGVTIFKNLTTLARAFVSTVFAAAMPPLLPISAKYWLIDRLA